MSFTPTRKRMINFSTIGLTDIVLLLLIFFLLTSSYIVQPGIKVKLPKSTTSKTDDSDKIIVTITAKQQLYVNQNKVEIAGLGKELQTLLTDHQDRLVVIRADKDISLEFTVRIIDISQQAGAERFIIATEPEV